MSVMDKKRVKSTDGWYSTYGLAEVPRWQYGYGGDSPLNLPVKNENGDADVATWSAKFDPPAVGAKVQVGVDGIGEAIVLGYFVEYGWLGVCVRPLAPPAWYVKQNGKGAICGVMGAELKALTEAAVD